MAAPGAPARGRPAQVPHPQANSKQRTPLAGAQARLRPAKDTARQNTGRQNTARQDTAREEAPSQAGPGDPTPGRVKRRQNRPPPELSRPPGQRASPSALGAEPDHRPSDQPSGWPGHQLSGRPGDVSDGQRDGRWAQHRLERQASYREVFAISEFRALWLAQVLSYVGDQFAQVAIAILVFERTGSAFLTGLAYALTYLPPIVGGPLLSGLADLFPRRRIMIGCDLIRAALVAGMAVPGTPFAVLCVLLSCTVLLGPPFSSARTAMLPDVLPGDKFVLGSAIGNMTYQGSQILGFVAGAAFVAALNPNRTLALDALSFLLSALILAAWVKRRPAAHRAHPQRPSLWEVARDGAALVFRDPLLRTLVLFGWLAGFYVLPEGLAAPYAHALHGSTFDVGLLMAAMPAGTVIGAFTLSRLVAPSTRLWLMGWMAMLSCAPLIVSAAHPPLWAVLAAWMLSGVGGAFQIAAAAAFVRSLPDSGRARAFGLAQSGLFASQGLGILIGGAAAEAIGPQLVVALSGLLGLTSAALLAQGWTRRRAELIARLRARSEQSG